jgi:hypothetical protein
MTWVQPTQNSTYFYNEQILFLQAIASLIFREFHRLVAGRPCVCGKNKQEFDNNISFSAFVSCSTFVLVSVFVSCLR